MECVLAELRPLRYCSQALPGREPRLYSSIAKCCAHAHGANVTDDHFQFSGFRFSFPLSGFRFSFPLPLFPLAPYQVGPATRKASVERDGSCEQERDSRDPGAGQGPWRLCQRVQGGACSTGDKSRNGKTTSRGYIVWLMMTRNSLYKHYLSVGLDSHCKFL